MFLLDCSAWWQHAKDDAAAGEFKERLTQLTKIKWVKNSLINTWTKRIKQGEFWTKCNSIQTMGNGPTTKITKKNCRWCGTRSSQAGWIQWVMMMMRDEYICLPHDVSPPQEASLLWETCPGSPLDGQSRTWKSPQSRPGPPLVAFLFLPAPTCP